MSARRQPLLRFPRSFARRTALLLALAAAFLPALIPGLHAGHGMPMLTVQAAHGAAEHQAVAVGHHHAHASGHDHAMGPRSEPATPAPASKWSDGACPICRTMQQLAAWTVPDGAVIAAPVAIAVTHVVPLVDAPTVPPRHTPSQPRAPPVAV